MGKKKQHHEEHIDETWLIPYADMLTLLLALFIVMFAMSKTDEQKFKRFSQEFNVIFAGGAGMSVLPNDGNSIAPAESKQTSQPTGNIIEQDKMNGIKNTLEGEIASKGYADKVKVELNNDGLYISIQDVVLFDSGDATVLDKVKPLLIQISSMLKGLNNNIRINGHTDNVPINTTKFRSNWDLSAMRAINVMHYMVDNGGLKPEKISIQAYGEYQPKFDNSTAEGRAKNRRVEILILREYPVSKK